MTWSFCGPSRLHFRPCYRHPFSLCYPCHPVSHQEAARWHPLPPPPVARAAAAALGAAAAWAVVVPAAPKEGPPSFVQQMPCNAPSSLPVPFLVLEMPLQVLELPLQALAWVEEDPPWVLEAPQTLEVVSIAPRWWSCSNNSDGRSPRREPSPTRQEVGQLLEAVAPAGARASAAAWATAVGKRPPGAASAASAEAVHYQKLEIHPVEHHIEEQAVELGLPMLDLQELPKVPDHLAEEDYQTALEVAAPLAGHRKSPQSWWAQTTSAAPQAAMCSPAGTVGQ